MDIVMLVSDFSYIRDVGKLLNKKEKKKGSLRFYSCTLLWFASQSVATPVNSKETFFFIG